MGFLKEKVDELYAYRPPLTKQPDFDAFWSDTLAQAKNQPLHPQRERVAYPSPFVTVYDIRYHGFDETPIHGWLILPTFLKRETYPCLIHYHGFTNSRGFPANFMMWATMGIAVLSVDCREQGGETGNCARYTQGGQFVNVTSKGLLDKKEYYYRAVYMDCLKAIDFAESCAEIDRKQIFLHGVSQGGGLGMAVAALDHRPVRSIVDVPSNSNIEKRVEGAFGSFASVTQYLKRYPERMEQVCRTLSYFDTMNLADRIQCPVYASVCLNDQTCPAKLYFATYNRIRSPKQITIYPFHDHGDAGDIHMEKKLAYLKESGIAPALL